MPNLIRRSVRAAVNQVSSDEPTDDDVEPVPEITPSHATFVTGFPCSEYDCEGTLIAGGAGYEDRILCSSCEAVYYLVSDE